MKKFITLIIAILASSFIQAQSESLNQYQFSQNLAILEVQFANLPKTNYCNKDTLKLPRKRKASRTNRRANRRRVEK